MDWRDEGMVLSVRAHGETSAIVDVFTAEHGRHAGIVRGGVSRKLRPVLQPGNQVSVEWSARLEAHLGAYRVEPLHSRAGSAMADRLTLEAMNALTSMVSFTTPEREALPELYAQTLHLADALGAPDWPTHYAHWEYALLAHVGFGLDLSSCAVTGAADGLCYVSPKSGRAVTAAGAGEWSDKLLELPQFLVTPGPADLRDIIAGLALTGHFLLHHLAPSLGKDRLPPARDRFIGILRKQAR